MTAAPAEEPLDGQYPLDGVSLALEDDEWVEWMPPVCHPLHQSFREMRLKWIGPGYAEQKVRLDARHGEAGDDIFVASFFAAERKEDGALVSYCVWGEGVTTLLPEADRVAFMRAGGDPAAVFAGWEKVVEVVGHLLEETEDYPPRHRTLGFPDEAILGVIGSTDL